jgi:hypothetical protein
VEKAPLPQTPVLTRYSDCDGDIFVVILADPDLELESPIDIDLDGADWNILELCCAVFIRVFLTMGRRDCRKLAEYLLARDWILVVVYNVNSQRSHTHLLSTRGVLNLLLRFN